MAGEYIFDGVGTRQRVFKMALGTYRHRRRGSMLVLMCVSMSLIALLAVVGMSLGGVFFIHNFLQKAADEIALSGAARLNQDDRIGRMNNLIAACRQLVYSSHDAFAEAEKKPNNPELTKLAQQLLNEARKSAQELESERADRLRAAIKDDAQYSLMSTYYNVSSPFKMVMPWLQVAVPKVTGVRFGFVDKIQSNVTALTGFSALEQHDQSHGYLQPGKLISGNVNADVPGEGGLDFMISSLAAPVNKVVSPAHLILADDFEKGQGTYLESTVQVEMVMAVATGLGPNASGKIRVLGTATTAGGTMPIPWPQD